MSETIVCRSKRSADCYDGESAHRVYEDGDMADDGTWDGESVVCDACYIDVDLPAAVGKEKDYE